MSCEWGSTCLGKLQRGTISHANLGEKDRASRTYRGNQGFRRTSQNKGDLSAQFGEALESQKYSFVNSVTTRVKNRAYLVGGRQSVGQLYERGLQPLSIRAVECYELDREQKHFDKR